jgi:POT family proton-dependent oligopeptide transporter
MTVKTTKKGERIIMDPAVTLQRVYLYFYFMVNVGSLVGSIAMVYAEKYVGFWLSFLLPTLVLCLCPMVIYACRNKYNRTPPTGSTISKAMKLIGMIFSQRWSWNPLQCRRNFKQAGVWDSVKPSALGTSKPGWMTFDDAWVDEVRRGILACKVFLWFPLYWLAYNQMTNNLTSQAATMKLGGVPNDIVNNFNPLFILLLVPVMDRLVYPGLQKMGLQFTPIKRITCGFFIAALAMVSACVTQVYIYRMSPCGNHANTCEDEDGNTLFAPISVWVQLLPYGLIGFSELMASVTSLEYAYTKAPANLKSSVQAISLATSAISSALAQALVSLADDPLLVWNYGVVAVLASAGGVAFYLSNMKTDRDDDKLNLLPAAVFDGRVSDPERDIGETSSQDIGRDHKTGLHERV